MSSSAPSVLGPLGVRGMTVLDRDKFSRELQVPTIKVTQQTNIAKIIQLCKEYLLKLEKHKPVLNSTDETLKTHIHLNPEKVTRWSDIEEQHRTKMKELGLGESDFSFTDLQVGYDNWSYNTIFKAVLPENEEIVSGFSVIGHIIHLNLRDHLLQYRHLIGQVFLDKIKACRTVVVKSNIIDNTYRNFSMEVVAGEEDFVVSVKESNCIFKLDFSKVYWNSRLGKEHERILSYLKPNDVLFDVFCGVGPFSVPAAKKKSKVFANDLNLESFKWLNYNAENNKINFSSFSSYNLDGQVFICTIFKDFILQCCNSTETLKEDAKIHVTMNLPAMAVEFVKYFKGLVKDEELIGMFKCEIIVYLYCFVSEDPYNAAKKLLTTHLERDMDPYITDVFKVRKVAPNKDMMRVTFKLTKEILFDFKRDSNCEPPLKIQKLQ